jgi:hypothetical protein
LGVTSFLWMGDNRDIVYGENKHINYFNTLWTHSIFRKSNHWKVDWEVHCQAHYRASYSDSCSQVLQWKKTLTHLFGYLK